MVLNSPSTSRPQPGRLNSSPLANSNFIIPLKASRAITISAPLPETANTKSQLNIAKVRNDDANFRDASLHEGPELQARLAASEIPTKPEQQKSKPKTSTTNETASQNTKLPSTAVTDSYLDIYANNYIPFWLRAVNQSFATAKVSLPLKHIRYDDYIEHFAGKSFLQELPEEQLPPLAVPKLQHPILCADNHELFWKERLHLEFCAQDEQYASYTLYSTHLAVHDASQYLFKLKLPGVRENTPRIDLGDIIKIRPLVPVLSANIGEAARKWNQTREGIAPGFIGTEYNAVVWSIFRRAEEITLRIDGGFMVQDKCNVLIPIQSHKCAPLWRAVRQAALGLSITKSNKTWLQKVLFPDKSDGAVQSNLSRATFNLQWYDEELNYEQKKAAHSIVSAKYGGVPYLISGPPGTGKTKTLVETALQMLRSTSKHKHHLLVCAPSDAAADTLLERLAYHGNFDRDQLFRLNGWTRSLTEVPGTVLPFCQLDQNNLFTLPDFQRMMGFRIVVTTCRDADMLIQARLSNDVLSVIASQMLEMVSPTHTVETSNLLHWTALLLDEAAQATEPEALIPLNVISPAFSNTTPNAAGPQVIMAGDEYQLGPLFYAKQKSGYEISLFQRLFERTLYADHPLSRQNGLKPLTSAMLPVIRPPFTNLIRNYRSHPAILSTPSVLFYHDTLIPEKLSSSSSIMSWPNWSDKSRWPVLFEQNATSDDVESVLEGDGTGAGSLLNRGEAEIAFDIVTSFLHYSNSVAGENLSPEEICVMSPFRAQVNHLRAMFRDRSLADVNIGPVEAYQGLEKRVVILCTTRTRVGQVTSQSKQEPDKYVKEDKNRRLGIIDEPKRFNVAITRAKEALIVIGNAECLTCTKDPCWVSFVEFCRRNHLISPPTSLPTISTDRNSALVVGRLEKALKYAEFIRKKQDADQKPFSAASESHDSGSRDQQRSSSHPLNKQSRKIKLKGARIDLDEEMWRMHELKMLEDSETIDYDLESSDSGVDGSTTAHRGNDHSPVVRLPDTVSPNIYGDLQRKLVFGNMSLGNHASVAYAQEYPYEEHFDRDFVEEMERAGCATQ